jgi:hypothetical protein
MNIKKLTAFNESILKMTKKNTFEKYAKLAEDRNMKLLRYNENKDVNHSTLQLFCNTCQTSFTSNCRSFLNARKTGCTKCKTLAFMERNKERAEENNKKPKSYTPRKAKPLLPEFAQISDKKTLLSYLKNTPNAYNEFMLHCLCNPPPTENTQKHHIIPRHSGGPDEDWNMVTLTVEDHAKAHELRWETYKDKASALSLDELALRGLRGEFNTEEMIKKRVQLSHHIQKTEKKGRWDAKLQSMLGKKGGAKQTEAKAEKYKEKLSHSVKALLKKGSTWKHKDGKSSVTFQAEELSLMIQLLEKLIEVTKDADSKKQITETKKSNATSLLARVIKGERLSAYGWQLMQSEG